MSNDFGMLGAKWEAAGFELFKDQREGTSASRLGIRLSVTRYADLSKRIRLSVRAVETIGFPEYISIRLDRTGRRLMVQAAEAGDDGVFLLLLDNGSRRQRRLLYNKPLAEAIIETSGATLEVGDKYCFHGAPAKSAPRALIFDLSRPEKKEVENDR